MIENTIHVVVVGTRLCPKCLVASSWVGRGCLDVPCGVLGDHSEAQQRVLAMSPTHVACPSRMAWVFPLGRGML